MFSDVKGVSEPYGDVDVILALPTEGAGDLTEGAVVDAVASIIGHPVSEEPVRKNGSSYNLISKERFQVSSLHSVFKIFQCFFVSLSPSFSLIYSLSFSTSLFFPTYPLLFFYSFHL